MLNLFGNLVVLVAFALAVKGLLAAREVTWTRLLLAVVGGYVVGAGVGILLLVDVTGAARPGCVAHDRGAARG